MRFALDYPSPWRAWSAALLSGLIGSASILALVIWMNESTKAPDQEDRIVATPMDLAQILQKSPPKPKPRRKATRAKRLKPIPTPDLGAALSGVDFGLPDISMDFDADNQLLSDQANASSQDSVDTPPQAVTTSSFVYPPEAKRKNLQGYVLLSVLINEHGEVKEAHVIESSPPGVFENSALEGIRRWRFNPAYAQGKPVAAWIQQKIVFQLG